MPTQTRTITSAYLTVAQGPGTVYLQFEDDKGEWLIHTSSTAVAAGTPGFIEHPMQTREVVLAGSGDYLQVRGRGEVRVAGTTLV